MRWPLASPQHNGFGWDQLVARCAAGLRPTSCRLGVKLRRTHWEQMSSGLAPEADIVERCWHFRDAITGSSTTITENLVDGWVSAVRRTGGYGTLGRGQLFRLDARE